MKRKNIQNTNGITISDSIVMSVKQKHPSMRKLYAAVISLIGMLSVIMAFLQMFHFRYNKSTVAAAFICFATFHILISLKGGKALSAYLLSIFGFLIIAYKKYENIKTGVKFVRNVIDKAVKLEDSTPIRDDAMKAAFEADVVTTLFVFYIWLLAIVICYFTICRPNPVLPLMVTFPLLEIGMYYGIKMPVFWGIMCIAYWLALLAMSTIDVGEYSGGQSGFVRKNNLFFPKRHMKLKVTERCGMFIIASVMIVAALSNGYLKITHYKRSNSINEKRRDITEAVEDFSFSSIGESIADIINAFGIDLDYEDSELGRRDSVRYKNVTDITVTITKPVKNAIYIKDDVKSVYKNNRWSYFPSSKYNDKVFDDFKKYDLYPQNFSALISNYIKHSDESNKIHIINSKRKKRRIFTLYGVQDQGKINYENDTLALHKTNKRETSYQFVPISPENIEMLLTKGVEVFFNSEDSSFGRNGFTASQISASEWRDKVIQYCNENGLFSYDDFFTIEDNDVPAETSYLYEHGNIIMAELLKNSYKNFVYENYLSVPDTEDMKLVHEKYGDLVDVEHSNSPEEVFSILSGIRTKMAMENSYTLEPGKTPSSEDFVKYFLIDTHKGYCTHYATSGIMLARMAGIPARYATGYIIVEDDLKAAKTNKDKSITIDVKDNRSHAWAEIYIDSIGWIPYEFTSKYVKSNPAQPPSETTTTTKSDSTITTTADPLSSTTSRNTNITSSRTTTTTTYVTKTVTTTVQNGVKKGTGFHIPKFIKDIFIVILFMGALFLLMLLRRNLILNIREKRLSTGNPRDRIRYMYTYAEKLLAEINLQSEYGNYKKFAADVEKWHGDIYFEDGGFEKLTDLALGTAFNNQTPSDEDLKKCQKVISDLGDSIFKKATKFEKFKLVFLTVLVKGE